MLLILFSISSKLTFDAATTQAGSGSGHLAAKVTASLIKIE